MPCGLTPPFPCDWISPCFDCCALRCLQRFQLFRLSNIPSKHRSYLTFRSPNPFRPPLVAGYAPSEAPEPLFTSVLCGRCCLLSLSPNPDSGEEILALRNSASSTAPSHLFLPPNANAADVMQLPTIDGMMDVGCELDVIGYALCAKPWIAL